ncbi:ABC transporter permease [Deinococcus yavapaiensis]|uniref:Peptide/nickel transport system permease protein n=1 Tax=Deinococcus yavapaiensis KR-236 TaxID=694435 RepID=A0A318SCS9_9DEIO|nr:ABC transporter permease [Deinococcus yavapaiensis]PYE49877.1 peptide/nickel transport system permease protein [Deinococcus yavapaiensis KR-236]
MTNEVLPTSTAAPSQKRRQGVFWRRMRKSTPAKVGAVIVLLFVVLAALAPVIRPYDPLTDRNYLTRLKPPSAEHIMGTDQLGRDVATRILHGARISLQVGIVATLLAMIAGALLGVLSGFFGGWFDNVIGYISDLMLGFPGILLAIMITAIIPSDPSTGGAFGRFIGWLASHNVDVRLYGAMLAVSIVQIPIYIRLARSVVLSIREREFVQAAGALGATSSRVMFRHVLPNSMTPLIVQGSLSIATATIEVAALGFLGLGATPPAPEWGTMIADAFQLGVYLSAPWTMIFPGLAILLTVLGFNLLGDGLRDVLDPRSTQ